MSPQPSHRSKRKRHPAKTPPPEENVDSVATNGPQFAEATATPDPTQFRVQHGSDKQAYSILDSQKGLLEPRPFPVVEGVPEPVLTLEKHAFTSYFVQANIHAAYLSANLEWAEQQDILRELMSDTGKYKLLYVTPEKVAKCVL
jgi:hypothetical protein